ncbi:MAG: amylosucrase [Lachnospiraceae bacterium]|nr:amylosucrase [Lachnospiraceae bacterium]
MRNFKKRFEERYDELKWLYMELYDNDAMLVELVNRMKEFYKDRPDDLKERDIIREKNPRWYIKEPLIGYKTYVDKFAGDLKGVRGKLPYIKKSNINVLHIMPFLKTGKNSDGGYAVADYRSVEPALGTMIDFEDLAEACHNKGINICIDFVMNHTSNEHEWAKKALTGDGEYMSRYFFFDNAELPHNYNRTMHNIFPTTDPGNFTYIENLHHYVLTTFHSYQWDLNYKNPRVFNEMVYNFLFLINKGVDIVSLDSMSYIWKDFGTSCRNRPRVHTIIRILRMITEIVCPGVLLLGEVMQDPDAAVQYFGEVGKPECHMLYNCSLMPMVWNAVATRDISLLKQSLDIFYSIPKQDVYLNFIRNHDDIKWRLDFDYLQRKGLEKPSHIKYLNDFFMGDAGYSHSKGELYNENEESQDAKFCGRTASMTGLERAKLYKSKELESEAIRQILMLYAFLIMQSGVPVVYYGDELGLLNDYSYKKSKNESEKNDPRNIQRGSFDWEGVKKLTDKYSTEARIFYWLGQLESFKKTEPVMGQEAYCWTLDTWEDGVLCTVRSYEGTKVMSLFNFTEHEKTAWIDERDGMYQDILSKKKREARNIELPPYGFYILKRIVE